MMLQGLILTCFDRTMAKQDKISNFDGLKTFIQKKILKPKFQTNIKLELDKNPFDKTQEAIKILDWLLFAHNKKWVLYDIQHSMTVFTGDLMTMLAQLSELVVMNSLQLLVVYQANILEFCD